LECEKPKTKLQNQEEKALVTHVNVNVRGSKTLGDKTLGTQDRRFKTLREKRLTHGLTRVDPECKKASDAVQRALIQNVRRKISLVTHESARVSLETHFPRAKGPAATTDGKAKRSQASLFSPRCKRSRIKSVFRILARRKLGREQNTIDCRIFCFAYAPVFAQPDSTGRFLPRILSPT